MARIKITVWTTLHGEVTVDRHFPEEVVEDTTLEGSHTHTVTSVEEAVRSAGEAIVAAHSVPQPLSN